MEQRKGIIVLEGPDAAGKSTLANAIVSMYGAELLHQTWNKEIAPRMFDYHTEAMLDAIELSQEKLVVLDRLWLSESVYADVFRGGTPWPLQGRFMDRVLMKHAAVTVLCLPDSIERGLEMHNKNLDPSHPYDDVKFAEVISRFRRFFYGCHKYKESDYASWYTRQGGMLWAFLPNTRTSRDYLHYNIDREGRHMDLWVQLYLLPFLEARRKSQYYPALDAKDHNILGHLKGAKVLFVGERTNNKGTEYNWPFYEYANSSLYLTQCLHNINFDETTAMWTNLWGPDGKLSAHILPLAKQLRVIALGDVVGDKLLELGVSNLKINHPQWARRFHANDDLYELMLKEVLANAGL